MHGEGRATCATQAVVVVTFRNGARKKTARERCRELFFAPSFGY
jgi:hypothetical protein